MKVKELIDLLNEYDPGMPVAIADWQEKCQSPSPEAADEMCEMNGVLVIGSFEPYCTSSWFVTTESLKGSAAKY